MGKNSKTSKGSGRKVHVKPGKGEEEQKQEEEEEKPTQDMELETIKQSRLPRPQKSPWLVYFSHGKRRKSHTFFSIPEGRCYVRNIPELCRKRCIVSSYGWLFLKGLEINDCLLINPGTMEKIHLPHLQIIPEFSYSRSECILSAPPTDPNCFVLFINWYVSIIVYWHRLLHKWEKIKYKMDEDGGILAPVACNGKVYGTTYNNTNLVVIEFNPNPKVTMMESVEPSYIPFSRTSNTRYMVESCGEIFFVCMLYFGHVDIVRTFEVFRMDFSEMKMAAVESIGDRAFFLSCCSSLSCSASESGVKRDCIYYVVEEDLILYRFDMADKSITMDLPCPNLSTPWSEPHWVLPSS